MKKTILILFAAVSIGFLGQAAYGCSCPMSEETKKVDYQVWAKGFNGAAFIGKVVKVEANEEKYENKVTFEVETYWRGVEKSEVVIYTGINGGICGVYYAEGEKYFVIANRIEETLRTFLCTEMEFSQNRKEYEKALGKGKTMTTPSDNVLVKFDEFGNINCEDELARLDALALELQNKPNSKSFIIIYGGKTGKRNEAKARIARIMHYLVRSRNVDPARVGTIDGGFRDTLAGEIWISLDGDSAPTATPTIDAKNVKLKGKAKVYGYDCGAAMGH